ncbi:hypothetical protein [Bryobacter aggregatus]|uniref:hypothetical protein n=1 Tax=Bryobacter aggregatus TaxID=360054 RepID=UPI0004E19185|nr:hypothetical protein [Bryobacter aggregatus]
MSMILRRIAVWAMEMLAEMILLGGLLSMLVYPGFADKVLGVLMATIAVALVLTLHWYYLSRAIWGLMIRLDGSYWYPSIAASIFVAHMYFAIERSRAELTGEARSMELPFLAGGACIVFACAMGSNRLLRRWRQRRIQDPKAREPVSRE